MISGTLIGQSSDSGIREYTFYHIGSVSYTHLDVYKRQGQSYAYDGVLGGKTGYTDAAGSTLVTYAKRGNSILIAVVLNSTNGAFPDTTSLLDLSLIHISSFRQLFCFLISEKLGAKNLCLQFPL